MMSPERKREYQRLWMAVKRGHPEALVELRLKFQKAPNYTPEEVAEHVRQRERRHRTRQQERAAALVGAQCYFCNYNERHDCLHYHKKDGEKHNKDVLPLVIKHPEQFVRLCKSCHQGAHFCMRFLGLSWEQIVEMYNKHKATNIIYSNRHVPISQRGP